MLPTTQTFTEESPQTQDQKWFSARPQRQFRLRAMDPAEVADFGWDSHVIVKKVSPGERLRRPLTLIGLPPGLKTLLGSNAPDAPQLDAMLDEMLQATMAGPAVDLAKCLKRAQARFSR